MYFPTASMTLKKKKRIVTDNNYSVFWLTIRGVNTVTVNTTLTQIYHTQCFNEGLASPFTRRGKILLLFIICEKIATRILLQKGTNYPKSVIRLNLRYTLNDHFSVLYLFWLGLSVDLLKYFYPLRGWISKKYFLELN